MATSEFDGARMPGTKGAHYAGCSKSLSSKAAADESTGGVAFPPTHPTLPRQLVSQVGYVEDAFEVRTPLANFFSILHIPLPD